MIIHKIFNTNEISKLNQVFFWNQMNENQLAKLIEARFENLDLI